MAATSGSGHNAPIVPSLALGGATSTAALPAIAGPNAGGTSPLGRERSSTNSIGGPPRKETSYASSAGSKISIASLPLDTLEHIIEDFKAQQQPGGKHRLGGGGRSAGAQHSVRISLGPSPQQQQPAGGRAGTRTWNGTLAGGGPGRWPGGAPATVSFKFNPRPSTPPGAGAAAAPPAPPQVLPGLPPGASLALSNRAAAVLQGSDSPAHLQRFLALDSGQLENHFIIASPNGAPIMDLEEICFDGAASVDGLPTGRDAVVVLTSAPDGVPVPRVVPLDQPGANSIRRTGMTAVLTAASASPSGSAGGAQGPDTADRALKSGGSSGSITAGGAQLWPFEQQGPDGGEADSEVAAAPVRSPHMAVPLSPQRSSLGKREFAAAAAAGTGGGVGGSPYAVASRAHLAAASPSAGTSRRSDTGAASSRPAASNRQMCISPSLPLSPPLRLLPSSPAPLAVHMQQNHHHLTSTYNMLPSLADGTPLPAAAPAAGGSAASTAPGSAGTTSVGYLPTRRAVSNTSGVAAAAVGAGGGGAGRQRRGSSEGLPVLVRLNSPDHAPTTGFTTAAMSMVSREGGGTEADGEGAESLIAVGESSWSVPGSWTGFASPQQWQAGRPGGLDDGLVSPSRVRLQAKINTLQIERERNTANNTALLNSQTSGQVSLHGSAAGGGGGGGGGGKGMSFGSGRTPALGNLTGTELIKAALKQVETGERTLADPRAARMTGSDSMDSHRTPRSSFTGSGAGTGSGAAGPRSSSTGSGAVPAAPPEALALAEAAAAAAAAAAVAPEATLEAAELLPSLSQPQPPLPEQAAEAAEAEALLAASAAVEGDAAIKVVVAPEPQERPASRPGSAPEAVVVASPTPPPAPPPPLPRARPSVRIMRPQPEPDAAELLRQREEHEEEEREEAAAAERRQARLVRSLTKLLTTGRGRRPFSAHSVVSEASRKRLNIPPVESSADQSDQDNDEADTDAAAQQPPQTDGSQPSGPAGHHLRDKSPSPRTLPPAGTHAPPPTHSGGSRPGSAAAASAAAGDGTSERPASAGAGRNGPAEGQGSASEQGKERVPAAAAAAAAAAGGGGDGEAGEDTLDAAAAVAADGGLDAEALLEFAQQLDRANMEFRLVEAARDRARRVEALLSQAALAAQQQQQPRGPARRRSSIAGETSTSGAAPGAAGGGGGAAPRVGSPERAGSVQGVDMYLLARRREGAKPPNVTQVISSLEAPLDRPMEVDLEALLGSIDEALQADEQEVRATRFDETFRIRTERYLAQLCRLNPAAFEEVSAAQAEADYRSSVERAKLRLRQLHGEVAGEPLTSAGKPRNQYDKAVVMLQAHRPFFLPPVISREAVERAPVPPMLGGRGSTRPPWDVYASIFRERKRSDARDLYDNEAVLAAQFNLDWSRTVSKMLFMKLVAREDLGVRQLQVRGKNGRAALEQELGQVREALAEAFGMIRSAFTYYSIATPEEVYAFAISAAVETASASGGRAEAAAAEVAAAAAAASVQRGSTASRGAPGSAGSGRSTSAESARPAEVPTVAESAAAAVAAAAAAAAAAGDGGQDGGYGILEMDEQRWLAFCTSAGITGRTPGVRVADLRLLFWTVNREEERNMTLESVENNDNAFMRFEFMEALVRAAFGRYITPGTLRDASDATRRLIKHLRASLPPLALLDPNDFRRNRLYTAEMEVAVVHNLELITASFKLYKARDRAKYLGVDHWISFLETNNLMAPHMGALTLTEAKLIFAWSQMVVVDELKLRRRAVSLQLWDFVEAVARLAERVALPNTDEMDRWMLYNLNIGRNTPLPPGHTRVWTYCNALATGRGGPGLERRPSGRELLPGPPPSGCPPSRPLATKFRLLMEYLAGSLADAWGGNNTHETAQSMLRTANMLCGGVELA